MRFGLLGLAWALVEYLGFVELGLGRTSVRFVAQSLTRSMSEVRQTVIVAVTTQALLGLAGCVALVLAARWLAYDVFDVPPDVRAEAVAMFQVVGASVATVVLLGALRGVLEGAQRFGVSAMVKIPTAAAAVLIPAIGATAGASLPEIMLWVLVVRLGAVAMLVFILPRVIRGFAWEWPREWRRLRALFRYSGWVAVSGVINPVLASFERFALGAFAGVAALGLYTAPYEGAVRLLLIPTSVFAALFPSLSAVFARDDERVTSGRLLESALRQLALIMSPILIILFAFAPEVLRLWLGAYFAQEMSTAFRILLIGVLANGLAHVPSVFLYAVGRPDLSAKAHMFELVIYIPMTVMLVTTLGMTGAALAWTVRVLLDAGLLSFFAMEHGAGRGWADAGRRWRSTGGALATLTGAAVLAVLSFERLPVGALLLLAAGAGAFALIGWKGGLAAAERDAWLRLSFRSQRISQRTS